MAEQKYPKELIDRIIDECRVEDVAAALMPMHKSGKKCQCPVCKKEDALNITKTKQVLKCFSCGAGYNQKTIIKFVQDAKGCDFQDAAQWLTEKQGLTHMLVQPDVTVKAKPPRKPKETSVRQQPTATEGSFRDRSLRESGITEEMQRMDLLVEEKGKAPHEVENFNRYTVGTINYQKDWKQAPGVDMLMHYVGLDRKLITFDPPKGAKQQPMFRCRFENPNAHEFHGKATKYLSPPKSGLHLWYPNKLIADFNKKHVTAPILTLQEGEKKADRICQVVPSVGTIGIHGLAHIDQPLPQDLERLLDKFKTRTVIMFMDADLFELAHNGDRSVDGRPKTFAAAAKKFRQHFHKLQTEDRRLNILLAHPTTLDKGIKGMDDLMGSGLIGNDELAEAIERGIKGHDHEHIKFYDLTTRTDEQIDALWHLNRGEADSYHRNFAHHYREEIKKLHGDEVFRLGRMEYRFDAEGGLEIAQPMLPEEQFYTIETNEKGAQKVVHSPTKLIRFMVNRNYYRYRERGTRREDDTYSFIHVRDNKVTRLPAFDLRDYNLEFIDEHEPYRYLVRDNYRTHHENLLGPKTFSLLPFEEPKMLRDERKKKIFAFDNGVWTVTPSAVTVQELAKFDGCIWEDTLIKESPVYCGPLFHLHQITNETITACTDPDWLEVYRSNLGRYTIELTEAGRQCVYLLFLCNTSNFYWREQPKDALWWDGLTADKQFETMQHLLAKITAMGHLLRKFRIEDADYDIFGMEGNLIEDDRADGRSGKSLFARLLSFVVPVVDIDGKKDPRKDIYIWDKVTPETNFIAVDDANPRLWELQQFYSRQTGMFGVRAMNTGEKQIPYEQAPHFYISSNWNMLANDASTVDRWRIIMFSDFYGATRKPQDIHNHLFYREWDDTQKSRFFSLMADSCMAYFNLQGVVQADPARADRRRWEKEIGKKFMRWADETFIIPEQTTDGRGLRTGYRIPKLVALGVKLDRKGPDGKHMDGCESWSYYGRNPEQRAWDKEQEFKRKLWLWCLLRGYVINPRHACTVKYLSEYHGLTTKDGHPYGGDDKQPGVECVTVLGPGQREEEDPTRLPREENIDDLPDDDYDMPY